MPRKRSTYTAEFKLQAVRMITDQKLSVAEAARRLDVGENLLRTWKKAFLDRGDDAFPGESGIPMNENRQRVVDILDWGPLHAGAFLGGPCHAFDDGIDELEMTGIGGQRHLQAHLRAFSKQVLCSPMVLDIPGPAKAEAIG